MDLEVKNQGVFDAIYARRSIREFTDQCLIDAQIEALLKAAMAAPSAINMQSWRFVVIQDKEQLKALRKMMPYGKFNAPCAICVCGELPFLKRLLTEKFWFQDCCAATENILLAAVGLGLGAVWCGVHPVASMENRVRKLLHLPENVRPLNIIYVGYPAEEKEPRTQFDPKKVFKDHYGDSW